ncbi:MAG: M48 family metallopeptidase, partial [Planctomycetota bacterium]
MQRRSYPAGALRRSCAALLFVVLACACHTSPVTGRRSLNAFSTGQDIELGREAYAQVLSEQKLVSTGKNHEMVARAMTRLSAVADDAGYEWEVSLIQDDKTVNAFALPGGKMAVYTGILPVCQSETGLAVVMGHEIGHVVARHGTERMTSTLGVDVLLSLLNIGDYTQLAQMGLDVLVNLPNGRAQESEADEIGLIYMARAGYDPREAVAFWERMESLGGGGPPEFLSTHPSHETRVERLKAKLPEALEVWR